MITRIQTVAPPYHGDKTWVLQYSITKGIWINHFWGDAAECIQKRKTIRKDLKKVGEG
mgnify:CR=1 FL=1